ASPASPGRRPRTDPLAGLAGGARAVAPPAAGRRGERRRVSGRGALLLAGSYLLGSISFSLLVVWLSARIDVRTVGSGNAGATNVLRTSGRWLALLVVVLDMAKGFAPVRFALVSGLPVALAAAAGFAAMI